MSEVSANRKYITLDNVRVAYRAKDDTVVITAKDKDLDSFLITPTYDSAVEQNLRKLLQREGLIPPDLSDRLPEGQENQQISPARYEIALGRGADGPFYWDVRKNAHLYVNGHTGSGKSALLALIGHHVNLHSEHWDMSIIGGEYGVAGYLRSPLEDQEKNSSYDTLERTLTHLNNLRQQMERTYIDMDAEKVSSHEELAEPTKKHMILVDTNYYALAVTATLLARNRDPQGEHDVETILPIVAHIQNFIRVGRAAGFHLVMTTQELLPTARRQDFGMRILMGSRTHKDQAPTRMFDSNVRLRNALGRAFAQSDDGEVIPFQVYRLTW